MARNTDIRPGYRLLLAIALGASLLTLGSRWLGLLQPLEWMAFDRFSRRGSPKQEPRICLVELTATDVPAAGSRGTMLVEALATLADRKVIVGLAGDWLRSYESEPLQAMLETADHFVVEAAIVESRPIDRDGVRRRTLLLSAAEPPVPSLSLMVTQHYLDTYHRLPSERPVAGTDALRLGQTRFEKLMPWAGGYVRADVGGFQILPNWQPRSFARLSLKEVLAGERPLCPIAFVGTEVASLAEGFYTPHSGLGVGTPPLQVPSYEYHAIATAHLLSAALEGERTIRYWPDPLESLWIAGWTAGTATIVWQFRNRFGFVGWATLVGVGAISANAIAAYGAFSWGVWLPVVPCGLGSAIAAIAATLTAYLWQLRELVRVRTAELQRTQELALLGKLMAGVSHDVRNPTQYILNFVEVCLHRLDDLPADRRPRWRTRLEGIATSAKTIDQVVQGLLATSQKPRPISLVPNQALQTICDLVAQGKAVAIETDFDPALDREVTLSGGLNTVTFNLLNNAVDAVAARSQPRVRVHARDRGGYLEIQVWDNGEGVPPELLQEQRLFAAFATTKSWGTGLGLFTVRELLDRCGGSIAVESDSRSWTQFTVRLPKLGQQTPARFPEE